MARAFLSHFATNSPPPFSLCRALDQLPFVGFIPNLFFSL